MFRIFEQIEPGSVCSCHIPGNARPYVFYVPGLRSKVQGRCGIAGERGRRRTGVMKRIVLIPFVAIPWVPGVCQGDLRGQFYMRLMAQGPGKRARNERASRLAGLGLRKLGIGRTSVMLAPIPAPEQESNMAGLSR